MQTHNAILKIGVAENRVATMCKLHIIKTQQLKHRNTD
jgi:hypothetical protein